MAVTDITTLNEQLPIVFREDNPPTGWDDFVVVPASFDPNDPLTPDPVEDALLSEDDRQATKAPVTLSEGRAAMSNLDVEQAATPQTTDDFPGSPQQRNTPVPPPDVFGFYLPFHFYYHNNLWGVYLVAEGVATLASILQDLSGNGGKELSKENTMIAARLFVYYHEAFHHNVEAFAPRLEVTHRQPLCKRGFLALYKEQLAKKASTEEGLATGYALHKVPKAFKGRVSPVWIEVLGRTLRRCRHRIG